MATAKKATKKVTEKPEGDDGGEDVTEKPEGDDGGGDATNTPEAKEGTTESSGELPSANMLEVTNSFRVQGPGGENYPAGTLVSKDDPVVKGREHLFRPASERVRERG